MTVWTAMHTDQWSLIVAVLALVVAGLAIKYARDQAESSRGQLEVAQRVAREQNEPYVIVNIEPSSPGSFLLAVVIQNIGPTMARNVKITVSPDLESSLGANATQTIQDAVSRTIAMIPPGRRMTFLFDSATRFSSGLPTVFDFTVTSDGPAGPVEPLTYTVDMKAMLGEQIGERPTKKLEDHVAKVAKGLETLAKSYQTANSDVIEDVHRRQYEAMQQRIQAQRQEAAGGDPSSS